MLRQSLALFLMLVSLHTVAQQIGIVKMTVFVNALMKQMTLDEKLGQLNLPGAGDITTGQASSSDIAKKIGEGKVGGLFNIKGVEKIKAVQTAETDNQLLGHVFV